MRKTIFALAMAALLAVPSLAEAQFGLAARVGTLGLGAEAALGVGERLVLRGGVGFMPIEWDVSDELDQGVDVEAKLKLPSSMYNIGGDLYLGSSFRIGGGVLFRTDDPEIIGTLEGSATIEIGDVIYTATEVSEIRGFLVAGKQAPYALIGFGKHTSSGIGLFVDLGVAFMGDSEVNLTATGDPTIVNDPAFQAELRQEETNIEEDIGAYTKYWPILNIGLRFGVGN